MNLIGFDFGTTNSTISFFNTEKKALDCFHPTAASADYIPTVVAYKGNETTIGVNAKNSITKKGFEVYEHFKLRMGKAANEIIEGRCKTPFDVTKDYIATLLSQYKSVQNITHIDGIVMTVPDAWFREASSRTARENIERLYRELGYDTETEFILESEPVAAAGYFCYSYEQNEEKNPNHNRYNGFITVIDYGGGTLDVTLCKVHDGGNIEILERCGFGEVNKSTGCAGVAFEEAVAELLCEREGIEAERGDKRYIKIRDQFEKELIDNTELVRKMMNLYYQSPDSVDGEVLLTLEYNDDEIEVFCEDLAKCFEKVNKPVLDQSLRQMQAYFQSHGVDAGDQEHFKVLLVGGFSNFYCVEENVRNFFGSKSGLVDKRFEQYFSDSNKSLAIAKGAALIAQKIVHVDHTCTHDIGYIVVRPDASDKWIDADIKIIEKGMKVSEAKEPIYAKNKVQARIKTGVFRVFMDDGRADGSGRINAALDQSVGELFPNMDRQNNSYQIGFSVDKNLIPSVHIKDETGAVNSVSLNRLLERISVSEVTGDCEYD